MSSSEKIPGNGAAHQHTHDGDAHTHDHDHVHDPAQDGDEDEVEEINVDITEDGMVWLHGSDFDLVLSPVESRELGQALIEAAEDAESEEA